MLHRGPATQRYTVEGRKATNFRTLRKERMPTMSTWPDKLVELLLVARDKQGPQLLGTCEYSSPSQTGVGGDVHGW